MAENWKALQSRWEHLVNIPLLHPVDKGQAQIIIGTNYAGLTASLEPDVKGKNLFEGRNRFLEHSYFTYKTNEMVGK